MQKNNMTHSDRDWPLPKHRYAMRMSWHDLLFAHWPVDAEIIQSELPAGLQADIWEGTAWIAVVPFRMTDVAPRGIPAIPGMSAFPELNVRTYVTVDDKPGVWFFSLDATNRIAVRVARFVFHLPYMDARMSIEKREDWYQYESHRTHRNEPHAKFVGRYRPKGEIFRAKQGSLEYWLTARYCLYATNRKGQLLRGEIDHPPWPLQQAELEAKSNSMLESFGVDTNSTPHLLFSPEIAVKAWLNELVAM